MPRPVVLLTALLAALAVAGAGAQPDAPAAAPGRRPPFPLVLSSLTSPPPGPRARPPAPPILICKEVFARPAFPTECIFAGGEPREAFDFAVDATFDWAASWAACSAACLADRACSKISLWKRGVDVTCWLHSAAATLDCGAEYRAPNSAFLTGDCAALERKPPPPARKKRPPPPARKKRPPPPPARKTRPPPPPARKTRPPPPLRG